MDSRSENKGARGADLNDNESVSSYIDASSNDLTTWPGAALIVADCMGTGILALPKDLTVLGLFGFFFLVINLPINYYAGYILNNAAMTVENRMAGLDEIDSAAEDESTNAASIGIVADSDDNRSSSESWNYEDGEPTETTEMRQSIVDPAAHDLPRAHHYGIDTEHTFDFIGITYSLFDAQPKREQERAQITDKATKLRISKPTMLVTVTYYTNIFLVLGNYILVMSHAVAAMIGEENICLPTAGLVASSLMFAISQLRTMATLGRSASIISLLALAIVVVQCLHAIQSGHEAFSYDENQDENLSDLSFWQKMVQQLAALSSIGFAVGSQKLFLNIRHEFKDRREAPKSLGIALSAFGTVYVLVCILAGPDPPSLLFDAISAGTMQRRLAGFFLWVHVAVSFAINSQALCSSLDRLLWPITLGKLYERHGARWAVLTFSVAISSYLIANAVPFFKDLVALIGALTSIPLTLLLPAIYHRKVMGLPLFHLGQTLDGGYASQDLLSFLLVVFSIIFLVCGLFGSLSSIEIDWSNHGSPFSCH